VLRNVGHRAGLRPGGSSGFGLSQLSQIIQWSRKAAWQPGDDDQFRVHLWTFSVGDGAGAGYVVGTPVFGGMIAASIFGIFVIPLLYITAEHLRGWRRSPKTK
jgi:hypothetical protein